MTLEQLNKRVERTLRRNRAVIKRAEERGRRLDRAAERSVHVVERAMRQLRQGSTG